MPWYGGLRLLNKVNNMRQLKLSAVDSHEYLHASAMSAFALPVEAHKAPVPEPIEDPLPGEHPIPKEDPVPSPNPEVDDPRP